MIKKCSILKTGIRILARVIDIIIAITAILILLPFFVVIILILRFTAEGEVFYFQERIGYKKRRFKIWKFATMIKNSINLGSGSITLKNDFRVTKFGKFLRTTKINELPQIINLLKGDLSLVGPRALVEKTFSAYSEEVQSKITNVKPGITGIGSIIFRDEETVISEAKNEDPFDFYKRVIAPHKGMVEIWYQENKTISTNIKIILLTAWVICFPKSVAYHKWNKKHPRFKLEKKQIYNRKG